MDLFTLILATRLSKKYSKEAAQSASEAASFVGSPLVASQASDMTDETKVYVYTGNEDGYTYGDWYYFDGEDWVVGGTYNSMVIDYATDSEVESVLNS